MECRDVGNARHPSGGGRYGTKQGRRPFLFLEEIMQDARELRRTRRRKQVEALCVGEIAAFRCSCELEARRIRQTANERWAKMSGCAFSVETVAIMRSAFCSEAMVLIERTK